MEKERRPEGGKAAPERRNELKERVVPRLRDLLGEASEPLIEGLLLLQGELQKGMNTVRVEVRGARGAAERAATGAKNAETASASAADAAQRTAQAAKEIAGQFEAVHREASTAEQAAKKASASAIVTTAKALEMSEALTAEVEDVDAEGNKMSVTKKGKELLSYILKRFRVLEDAVGLNTSDLKDIENRVIPLLKEVKELLAQKGAVPKKEGESS